MNIVLLQDVKHVGFAGDIADVAIGYARNFLIPKGLATEATPSEIQKAEQLRKKRIVKHEEIVANADKIAEKLNEATITLTRKVSSGDHLFGGVSENDIAEAIKEQCKVEIDKSHVHLEGGHIRNTGDHIVDVHLYEGKHIKIDVKVVPEEEK
jgi:large subunit ribosomal protein L9